MNIDLEKNDKIILNNSGNNNQGRLVLYATLIVSLLFGGGCNICKENKAPEIKEPGLIAELGGQSPKPSKEELIEEPTAEIEESTEEFEEPINENPIEEPTIEEPTIEEPIIEEPTIEEPIKKEPTIEVPIIEEPTIPAKPVDPVILPEPTKPESSVDFMSEEEVEEIIDHIISQLAGDSEKYRNPSRKTIRNLIYLLNGRQIGDRLDTEYAIHYLAAMIETTTGYEVIDKYIDDINPYMKRTIISIEDMIDKTNNKDSYEYLVKYFDSKQSIYEALEEKKNPGSVCLELVKFTDKLHKFFSGEIELFGETLETISLDALIVIVFDYENMNGNLNYAEDYGILDKYNIKPQYDFDTKYQQYEPIMKATLAAIRERSDKKISSLTGSSLLAKSTIKSKEQPAIQFMKKYNNLPI
ncbi:MAG: hypothetical protein ACOXZS_01720 [Bacilli bacterium]